MDAVLTQILERLDGGVDVRAEILDADDGRRDERGEAIARLYLLHCKWAAGLMLARVGGEMQPQGLAGAKGPAKEVQEPKVIAVEVAG